MRGTFDGGGRTIKNSKLKKIQLGENITLYRGDCLEVTAGLAENSVQCVITSPPYWGLRDYGMVGQLGLEKTPEEYIEKMVEVFRGVWRVLRDDGILFLNMGDSYCNAKGKAKNPGGRVGPNACFHSKHKEAGVVPLERPNIGDLNKPGWMGIKSKDLCGIPWRLALALQADGWYLRQDVIEEVEFYCPDCGYVMEERIRRYGQDREVIWAKPNPMPESCTDRCTKAHEYVFILTKKPQYYYDAEAVKETATYAGIMRGGSTNRYEQNQAGMDKRIYNSRNKRSVWTIPTQSCPEAHFATFPEKLVEPCILAGTSEKGCCPECGAAWERIVEISRSFESGSGKSGNMPAGKNGPHLQGGGETLDIRRGPCVHSNTTGWRPRCKCEKPPVPCTVLDPFFGAGTVGVVAVQYGRRCIGIELSADYIEIAARRIEAEQKKYRNGPEYEPDYNVEIEEAAGLPLFEKE